MEKYTIYCTEEQTKKAFELGAPIKTISYDPPVPSPTGWVMHKGNCCKPPTTEQMIGWMEEQGFAIEIILSDEEEHPWTFVINKDEDVCVYDTRKEATLAAIDAALDYLNNSKK